MASKVQISGNWIGDGEPCFIIAEAGVNHNGDLYAWTDECTHAGASLSEGDLEGDQVECYERVEISRSL